MHPESAWWRAQTVLRLAFRVPLRRWRLSLIIAAIATLLPGFVLLLPPMLLMSPFAVEIWTGDPVLLQVLLSFVGGFVPLTLATVLAGGWGATIWLRTSDGSIRLRVPVACFAAVTLWLLLTELPNYVLISAAMLDESVPIWASHLADMLTRFLLFYFSAQILQAATGADTHPGGDIVALAAWLAFDMTLIAALLEGAATIGETVLLTMSGESVWAGIPLATLFFALTSYLFLVELALIERLAGRPDS